MRRFLSNGLCGVAGGNPDGNAVDCSRHRRPEAHLQRPCICGAVFSWTGFYVGLNAGYGRAHLAWIVADPAPAIQPKGRLTGGTIGYNLQTGEWVWGPQGDIDWSRNKGTHACGGGSSETKNTRLATAGGRFGYAFDCFLPYITGGAAFADIKMRFARRRRRQ